MSLRMDCPECGLRRYAINQKQYEHLKNKPCLHCRGILVSLKCSNCGREYKKKNWEIDKKAINTFCCQKCYFEYKGKVKTSTKERLCIQCGEEFKPAHKTNKFCSRMCFGAYRKRHPISIIRRYTTRPKKKRFCISCGNETIKSRKYCDACRPVTIFVRTYSKMKECAYCHNMFDTGNNRKRVYCSRSCYGLAMREKEHSFHHHVCVSCGKEFDNYLNNSIYCSMQCATQRFKPRTCKACGIKFARTEKRKANICPSCREITIPCLYCLSPTRAFGTRGTRRNFCNRRCSSKYLWGNPEYALRTINARMERIQAKEKTNIEKITEDTLLALKMNYRFNHPLYIYFTDFALLDYMIGIECDGLYWHKTRIAKDKKRDEAIRQKTGWEIIRLSEAEIKADARNAILVKLKERGIDLALN